MRWSLWTLAALACLATACSEPAPSIDTAGMEPPVQRLIETRRLAVNASPEGRTWGELGDALFAHGLERQAADCYAEAADADIDPFEWRYLQALSTAGTPGGMEHALGLYRRALALRPEASIVELRVGLLLQALGRFEEAAASFERAATDTALQRAQRGLGQVLLESGRTVEAVVRLEAAVAANGQDAAAWSALAQAYATLGRDVESRAAASRAGQGVESAGFHDSIYYAHVVESGVSAARRFERALHALSDDDPDGAREHVDAILEYHDDQADAYYLMGLIESRSGNSAAAGANHQRALEVDPAHVRSLLELASLAEADERFGDALGWIEQARRVTPEDASIVRRLVRNRYQAGDFGGLLLAMERLIELQPDAAATHVDLADLYVHAERWTDAERHYREAIRLAPGSEQATYAEERIDSISRRAP